jgi:histone H3/H4
MLIKRTSVRDIFRDRNLRMDGALVDELEKKLKDVLDAAVKRAIAAGRQTVRKEDL